MKKTLIATAIFGILGGTFAFSHNAYGQTVNSPVDDSDRGQSVYSISLSYCESRGGLSAYIPKSDIILFSCGDDPHRLITITK